ncbi:helix-turn-helix transcriptional regulator [Metabacillus sp. RGM 3146]|uniref:helix-turn-helix transcriptional regulator n=1 Tax=Metabacillus sp. RGM 3146 TaxID=3401092 RepID=UPI003B9B2260
MPVRNKLFDIRHDLRLKQTEFSRLLDLSPQQYNRYEKNSVQPTLEIAIKISEKLDRTVNDIFGIIR